MKNISIYIIGFTIFFIAAIGLNLIVSDIGIKNNHLNNKSLEMISNLELYKSYQVDKYKFSDKNSINYSLTGYENVAPEDRDNAETKGFLSNFLYIKDIFTIVPLFLDIILPIDMSNYTWAISILFGMIGFLFVLSWYKAWKQGEV